MHLLRQKGDTMKNTGMIIKLISLILILCMLGMYQTVAAARSNQRAAIEAQIKAEEKRRKEEEKALADEQARLAAAKYIDGIYEGQGLGYGGDIKVKVTVKDGEIYTIDVTEHSGEDDEYFRLAVGMIDKIIEENAPEVDVATGSTFSSEGLLEAINSALEKAVKQ